MTEELDLDPVPDLRRLRDELRFIEKHPELWDQLCWFKPTDCGTAGCLAGNTVLHAGATPARRNTGEFTYTGTVVTADDRRTYAADEAQRLLGLTEEEANELFDPFNTLDDLRRIGQQIAARVGKML